MAYHLTFLPIFERFSRVTDLSQRATPGLGMGWDTVPKIAKRQSRTITGDSAVGKGSTFMVTLPHTHDVRTVGSYATGVP